MGIIFKVLDQLNFIDIGSIPQRHEAGDPQFFKGKPVHHGSTDGTALTDDGDRPLAR